MQEEQHSLMWTERRHTPRAKTQDARSPFDIDYARVVHSASFRRLQGKTQILNLGDSDFYRTRLTHSLEVAQIAGGLVEHFRKFWPEHPAHAYLPEPSLIQTVGFTHDLGHPPFGHGGEVALNYCMRDHGGYEGNGQTLRILTRLESFSESHGANLTRRTLLGVMKYPAPFSAVANPDVQPRLANSATLIRVIDRRASEPPKCYLDSEQEAVDWVLAPLSQEDRAVFQQFALRPGKHGKPLHKSFDCSIMDLADDIAYGVHDLEDAIALSLIGREQFEAALPSGLTPGDLCGVFLAELREGGRYAAAGVTDADTWHFLLKALFGTETSRKRLIGDLVHHFVRHARLETDDRFAEPLLRHRAGLAPAARRFLDCLRELVMKLVITSPQVQQLEFKGQQMVISVFEALASDPQRLLPVDVFAHYEETGGSLRSICDYVASMTDGFLLKTYDRLFSPRMGSVFDRL